ncbi:MAG: hypothetical protein JWP37_4215 [Mucilaginibacter sp.]|nr:hypothetical protein [Mucilaginibacter sp.]
MAVSPTQLSTVGRALMRYNKKQKKKSPPTGGDLEGAIC